MPILARLIAINFGEGYVPTTPRQSSEQTLTTASAAGKGRAMSGTTTRARVSGRGAVRAGLAVAALAAATALTATGLFGAATAGAATTDLACGRPASASSNSGSAGNAVDCAGGTVWQSTTGKPQQLQVDLGGNQP